MKLITLNVWGGKLYEPLINFISRHSSDTDIFCFQDTLFGAQPEFSPIKKGRINLHYEICSILSDFTPLVYGDPEESYFDGEMLSPDVGCGQAIFIKKTSGKILDNGGFRSHPESPYHKGGDMVSGRCQWVKISTKDGDITILNLHGLWKRDSNKKDTPERLYQSQEIKRFFETIEDKKIICGDFNLAPDTQAMEILDKDMRNLIKEFEVTSTRNKYYEKEEQFADYILVSNDVEIKDFKVLQDEVSDHLSLLVEFL